MLFYIVKVLGVEQCLFQPLHTRRNYRGCWQPTLPYLNSEVLQPLGILVAVLMPRVPFLDSFSKRGKLGQRKIKQNFHLQRRILICNGRSCKKR